MTGGEESMEIVESNKVSICTIKWWLINILKHDDQSKST
jgi:hypothetical protein